MRPGPPTTAEEELLTTSFPGVTVSEHKDATNEHVTLTPAPPSQGSWCSVLTEWERAFLERGYLVTKVPSSVGLCHQEVRSLPRVPYLGFLLRPELPMTSLVW